MRPSPASTTSGLLIYPTIFLAFLPECHNKLNEEVPAGNVENEGFKHMINVIEPRYDLPSRVHFSEKVIPKLYEVKAERKGDPKNAEFLV